MMSLHERLLDHRPARRVADWALGQFSHHRCRQLDRLDAARVQERTLLRLVRHAAKTHFGRDHGFDRVRTIADFQDRVPLRDYEAFRADYWQKPFPYLQCVSWPEHLRYFGLSSGTTSGSTKYIPQSDAILRSDTK